MTRDGVAGMTHEAAVLLALAREAIGSAFLGGEVAPPAEPWLQTPAAVFVTLRTQRDGELRGCIGSIEARLPLGDAVVAAARAAAFDDPRFEPLSYAELSRVRLDVSVLSPLARLPVHDETEACQQLARTRPGVLLRHERRQGLLLPQVWESVPEAAEFLRHLKRKAGLPPTFWSETVELHVFTCDAFAEAAEAPARLTTT